MPKHVLAKLESELRELKQALLNEIPQEISRAAGQGDLSENAEYEQALAKRDMYQSKVVALEKRITEISSLDTSRLPKDKAAYGSELTVIDLDTNEKKTYQLVLPEELSGDHKDYLSISSPVGMALVGQEEGNEVRVTIPRGTLSLEIVKLKTVHDRKK
ncbi:MAG: transcription elongation factor GreA [Acidobacteriota bacterium]|jgi:transcription elongation factor GreA